MSPDLACLLASTTARRRSIPHISNRKLFVAAVNGRDRANRSFGEKVTKNLKTDHFYLNGQSDRLQAANQGRTNSNDQPETPVISKHPENARFGADFCPRVRAFAGYDKDSQSERATSAHVNRIRRFSQNSQVFSQPLHLFGQMVSLFRA